MLYLKLALIIINGLLFALFCVFMGYLVAEYLTAYDPFYN